eukprot:15484467-Alexandrium_andersonii.AAC.1
MRVPGLQGRSPCTPTRMADGGPAAAVAVATAAAAMPATPCSGTRGTASCYSGSAGPSDPSCRCRGDPSCQGL